MENKKITREGKAAGAQEQILIQVFHKWSQEEKSRLKDLWFRIKKLAKRKRDQVINYLRRKAFQRVKKVTVTKRVTPNRKDIKRRSQKGLILQLTTFDHLNNFNYLFMNPRSKKTEVLKNGYAPLIKMFLFYIYCWFLLTNYIPKGKESINILFNPS